MFTSTLLQYLNSESRTPSEDHQMKNIAMQGDKKLRMLHVVG
jgi:hypothetical protein